MTRGRGRPILTLVQPQPRHTSSALTYDDYLSLPDDGRRYEIIGGDLHVTPAPGLSHQRISRNLEFILHAHVRRHRLGEMLYAPVDVILGPNDVVQPDLVFVSSARRGILSERGVEGAPDLVIEILSPATSRRDQGIKAKLYARAGVAHYWILSPEAQTLTELVLQEGRYDTRGVHVSPAAVETAVLPGLSIGLDEVFAEE